MSTEEKAGEEPRADAVPERTPDGDAGAAACVGEGAAAGAGADGGLSERDRALLALERRGWAGPGEKERAIRERLGMSPTRYYQLLNALLDDPYALAHDPVTVNRLRRRRDSRRTGR